MSAPSNASEKHPVLLSLNISRSDAYQRSMINGTAGDRPPLQRVICDNARYADATYAAWVNRRIAKGLHCGGGWMERYVPRIADETFEDAHRRYVASFVGKSALLAGEGQ